LYHNAIRPWPRAPIAVSPVWQTAISPRLVWRGDYGVDAAIHRCQAGPMSARRSGCQGAIGEPRLGAPTDGRGPIFRHLDGGGEEATETMDRKSSGLLKKLLFRLDGAADSHRVEFTSQAGSRWQAELCLYSGTNPQSPRLLVMFRNRSRPEEPQRYTFAPPAVSKVPREAADQLGEADLRELLSLSVRV